ncbi:5532_t:CDS:1 [Funneliformis geosporum]|uniref:inorganic diphosphatase n=1 Tax=Funneliformis geosporum TaxID=1117311 RepID=A0A9W4SAV3_9GLOM|nr:5532_t:CDS:1 [Funneliformis geosporum]
MEIYMKVEIPKGSFNKIEYNKTKKRFELDRVLSVAMTYPGEYGVIPETLAPDGDELDVICLTIQPTFSGLYIPVRIIGVLRMVDKGEQDDKLLAVNAGEPELNHIQKLADVPHQTKEKIKHFFARYKDLEGKKVEIGEFEGKEQAETLLKKCQEVYQK